MHALPIEAIYPRGTRIILEAIEVFDWPTETFANRGIGPVPYSPDCPPKMARDRVARFFSQPMQADREICYPVVRGTMTR